MRRILRLLLKARPRRELQPSLVAFGYHGCPAAAADQILRGASWIESVNQWDWLGRGIYFFQDAPLRARLFAEEKHPEIQPDEIVVLRAEIELGSCIDFFDIDHHWGLEQAYAEAMRTEEDADLTNTQSGGYYLDRAVVDLYCQMLEEVTGQQIQTVRGYYPEGEPVFKGSKILKKSHVQIAVRDEKCIRSVSRHEFNNQLRQDLPRA